MTPEIYKKRGWLDSYYLACCDQSPDLIGMLSTAEKKIGSPKLALCWNLPLSTCVGASAVCRGRCYFWKMIEGRADIAPRAEKNLPISKRPDFVELMAGALEVSRVKYFRIHDFGDFFSAAYIRAWVRIATLEPDIRFWTYTRSWRMGGPFLPALRALAKLPNVNVLLSADRETKRPRNNQAIEGTTIAWFADTDLDCYWANRYEDRVVFRGAANRKFTPYVNKYDDGAIICPNQDGSGTFKPCIECQRCIKKSD